MFKFIISLFKKKELPLIIPEDAKIIYDKAIERGWLLLDIQENIKMISFKRCGVRLNYYYSTGTVATAMNHPTKGRTQLYRKNLDYDEIVQIINNPRKHTGEGYYKK